MRGFLVGVAATLVVLCAGVLLVLSLGLFPVGADNPPSSLERRLAHMATGAYLSSHAPKQENPVQPTPAALSDGARIYEKHCAVCHGGALQKISPLQRKFSPGVPQLVNRVPRDPDAEFYWITKHGFRMTGMPAWDGILNDDQIWTVVAFIKRSDKLPPEAQAAWQLAADTTRPPAVAPVAAPKAAKR